MDSDDEDADEEEADEADAMHVDDDEDDEDVEGDDDDDMDADGDEEDDQDATPASRIVLSSHRSAPAKPSAAQEAVEAKELAVDEDEDEDLSELVSDSEGEDEDAEGEDDDGEAEDDDELAAANDNEEMDSGEDMSRSHTPDLSKMTRRQQAMVVQSADASLMALSNGMSWHLCFHYLLITSTEAQKKKHLTAEEHAMRRAEMARRRKNLSEKRNEEEKVGASPRIPRSMAA